MTVKEFLKKVYRRVGAPDYSGDGNWSQAEVIDYANDIIKEIAEETNYWLVKNYAVPAVADQIEFDFPDDYIDLVYKAFYYKVSTTNKYLMAVQDMSQEHDGREQVDIGAATPYQVTKTSNTTFSVVPAPSETATVATSGTLTVGVTYRITAFQAGDDFTNVGAASNATNIEFTATGTTPTDWTNSSEVTRIDAEVFEFDYYNYPSDIDYTAQSATIDFPKIHINGLVYLVAGTMLSSSEDQNVSAKGARYTKIGERRINTMKRRVRAQRTGDRNTGGSWIPKSRDSNNGMSEAINRAGPAT